LNDLKSVIRDGVVKLDFIYCDDAKDRFAMQDCPAFLDLLLDPPKPEQENIKQPRTPEPRHYQVHIMLAHIPTSS
jgi:hypothetical protein